MHQLDPAALRLAALDRRRLLGAAVDLEEGAGRQRDAERQHEQQARLVDLRQGPDHGQQHALALLVDDPLPHLAELRRLALRQLAAQRPVLQLLAVARPLHRPGRRALGGRRGGLRPRGPARRARPRSPARAPARPQAGAGRDQRRGREPGARPAPRSEG